MSKTITLRLTEEEYDAISKSAKAERRPVSNFITHTVVREIESSYNVDNVEMDQIKKDKKLLGRLAKAHKDAAGLKGKLIG